MAFQLMRLTRGLTGMIGLVAHEGLTSLIGLWAFQAGPGCDRTTSKMRGSSPKIISGDS
jgi:hypothetical protein